MGAGRENMSIWRDIKMKKWTRLRRNLKSLISISVRGSWDRDMIIKDSFKIPFNRFIGCRVFGHVWSSGDDAIRYDFNLDKKICWKCHKWVTKSDIRKKKIKKLLKC